MSLREPSILPGFGLTFGFTTVFLSTIVLLPLAALVLAAASMHWSDFLRIVLSPRALGSYRLSFGASLLAASINLVFGFIIAWTLVRYEFPGRKLIDALIDMPFALPTAVSGIALTTVFAQNGWIGRYLEPLGDQGGVHLAWRHARAHPHQHALRGARGAAGAARGAAGAGGGGRDPGSGALLCVPPHHPADHPAGAAHRLHARPSRARWANTAR